MERIVFRAADQKSVMRGNQAAQPIGVLRHALFLFEILIEDRQRIVGKRNAGHLGALAKQLPRRDVGRPAAVGAGADRAGEDQDFVAVIDRTCRLWIRHGRRSPTQPLRAVGGTPRAASAGCCGRRSRNA